MSGSIVQHPLWAMVLGVVCGVVGFRVGWRSGHRIGLPLVQAVLGGIAFLSAWSTDGPARAAIAVAGWAIGTTAVSVPTFARHPEEADRRVLRAAPYREEMRAWLATGRGPEARPVAMVVRHAVELAVYVVCAVLTMNLLAIAMGAVLLNYMNAWVASLLGAATRPWPVLLLAWHPWSVVRVAAYVAIGVAAAWPLARATAWPVPWEAARPLAIGGAVGVVLDLVLKLALSPPVGRVLQGAVDLERIA